MTRVQHPIRDFGLALSLLTAVPSGTRWPEDGRAQSAGWFPAIGGVVGAVGYGMVKLAETAGVLARAPYVIAALTVVVWALLTRMLHWDGLADVADGFWGSHDRERRLEIMSDSHTGAFGATAVALTAILEVAALGAFVATDQSPVLLVPVFARCAATAAAWLGEPARAGGLGSSVMGRPTIVAVIVAVGVVLLATAGLWIGFGAKGLALAAVGLVLALGVPHVVSLRFGGVTGDVMGASVLVTEALLLAAFALVL